LLSQGRRFREYQLIAIMLNGRELLYAEFIRVAGVHGHDELLAITDRDKIRAILDIEFPNDEFAR